MKTVKITFREDYNANGKAYKKGQEYDVPDHKARIYVKSGLARATSAEAKAVVAEDPAATAAKAKR